ncbi:MAG: gamma-glutamyl-gamma-aminobutyrate hydrolase family protein [Planctomycetota bacterium]|nr:gamma-glutamyl-gamma-aminobutyrate hydrolase family protein [Planctomycetota bacterium]
MECLERETAFEANKRRFSSGQRAVNSPRIGITPDIVEGRVTLAVNYVNAVVQAGGVPLILPPRPELAPMFVEICDAVILSGGDDVIMEDWGQSTHEAAVPVDRHRQDFERAMIAALDDVPQLPVLGICLGMQLMGIEQGASFAQHLPDMLETAEEHRHDSVHLIEGDALNGKVTSHHHQALLDAGRLEVIARAHDGVVEGISDPDRHFYLGVQWHPERTEDDVLGPGLFRRLVAACRAHHDA